MIKIGILPTYNENKDRPFQNTLSFVNNYPKRIVKQKAIPEGILFPDGVFNERLLKPYDGFLIPGGSTIRLYHLLTIHYAIINNKPLLGICMGTQAIGVYSNITNILKKQNKQISYKTITNVYKSTKEENFLKQIENHNKEAIFYNTSTKKSSHKIYIKPDTKLYRIYKRKTIIEPSIHTYVLKKVDKPFIINAVSKEGYIEGIENTNNFIMGLEFHPELEDKNDVLFQSFIKACKTK